MSAASAAAVAACAEQNDDVREGYVELKKLCDAKAKRLLNNFVKIAPGFFGGDAQSRARRLFAKTKTKCCKLGRRRSEHAKQ